MAIVDTSEVAFSSSFAVDKVVRIFTGSYNAATDVITRAGTFTAYCYRIAHGLPRPVACDIITSTDGGTTWNDGGTTNGKVAFSDSTYIYILDSIAALGAGTVQYKVWCSWIDDYDSTNPLIDVISYDDQPVQFDSRLNYQKVFANGVASFTPGTFGSQQTNVITHSLGYTPNSKVFFEAFSGEVWPLNAGGQFQYDNAQDECELFIYTNRIEITMSRYSNSNRRAWYRIYYDAN